MTMTSVSFFTVSLANFRDPIMIPMPHILIEDTDEDALDQDCVRFEDIESDLAYQLDYEDRIAAGDFEPIEWDVDYDPYED